MTLDASASSDPDPQAMLTYEWDTDGDGVLDPHVGARIGVTYTRPGSVLVSLRVMDETGRASATHKLITVTKGASPRQLSVPAFLGSSANRWWNPAWRHRRRLVIDNSGLSADLVDFPLLVRVERSEHTDLDPEGRDLRFVDSTGATIPHELEPGPASGTIVVWVRVPRIARPPKFQSIAMYYANPRAVDAQAPSEVWDVSFAGVWHLAHTLKDSTANGNHGTDFRPQLVVGPMSGARHFDGRATYVDLGADSSFESDVLTLEAWVQVADLNVYDFLRIISKKEIWSQPSGFDFDYNPMQSYLTLLGSGTKGARVWNSPLTSGWHYLAGIVGGGIGRLYIDGREFASTVISTPLAPNALPIQLGKQSLSPAAFFHGSLDEVRISRVARSAAWIDLQYRSMSGSLLFFAAEETVPISR